jgi:hypothetical protein
MLRIVALLVALLAPLQVAAVTIPDATWFDSIPHTHLDFETDGDGDPVPPISPSQSLPFGASEYSAVGVTFSQDLAWVNYVETGNVIPQAGVGDFSILFSSPVRSVGALVTYFPPGDIPSFVARNAAGDVLGSVQLDDYVPGLDPEPPDDQLDPTKHFMGLAFDEPIARLDVSGEALHVDDLQISAAVPEPASLALLGLGLAALATGSRLLRKPGLRR